MEHQKAFYDHLKNQPAVNCDTVDVQQMEDVAR